MIFEELEAMEAERKRLMMRKLATMAAVLLQRNFRRIVDTRLTVMMRRSRAGTEKQVGLIGSMSVPRVLRSLGQHSGGPSYAGSDGD